MIAASRSPSRWLTRLCASPDPCDSCIGIAELLETMLPCKEKPRSPTEVEPDFSGGSLRPWSDDVLRLPRSPCRGMGDMKLSRRRAELLSC